MQRRRFLTMAACSAAAAAWPSSSAATTTTVATHAVPAPRLLVLLGNVADVRDLGLRYLQLVPSEHDSDVLASAILPGPLPAQAASVPALVDRLITSDFSEGRTVTVHGWVLSVTEARQCALYALQST